MATEICLFQIPRCNPVYNFSRSIQQKAAPLGLCYKQGMVQDTSLVTYSLQTKRLKGEAPCSRPSIPIVAPHLQHCWCHLRGSRENFHALTGALSEALSGTALIFLKRNVERISGILRATCWERSLFSSQGPGTWVHILLGPHPRVPLLGAGPTASGPSLENAR